jgi:hypothetical protein
VPFTVPPSVSGVVVFIHGTPSFSPVTIMTQYVGTPDAPGVGGGGAVGTWAEALALTSSKLTARTRRRIVHKHSVERAPSLIDGRAAPLPSPEG